jgi:hypothetical protein
MSAGPLTSTACILEMEREVKHGTNVLPLLRELLACYSLSHWVEVGPGEKGLKVLPTSITERFTIGNVNCSGVGLPIKEC